MLRKTLLFPILIISAFPAEGQMVVSNNLSVENYVQNVLLGNGVTVSNVQFNGSSANVVNSSVGLFNDPGANLGLTSGLIMGSGNIQMAAQNNSGNDSSLGGTGMPGTDTDLQAITADLIYDECVIEFDFVPSGDTISFRYVFASEEYPEYVCGNVNDVFGFFLSGINPFGADYTSTNIALIPDPLNPGQYTNTPVSINTVNTGLAGFYAEDSMNCENADPLWESYSIYYAGNNTSSNYEYDGRTVVLTAQAAVTCGETYHIKLAIGDAGDPSYDSGVFIEANSFNSNGLSITANTSEVYEGCKDAYFLVARTDASVSEIVPLIIQGTATNGVDYTFLPNQISLSQGQFMDTLWLEIPMNDDNGAVYETVEIYIDNNDACFGPTIRIYNTDPIILTLNEGDTLCPDSPLNEVHTFISMVTGGVPSGYSYLWEASPVYDFGLQQGQGSVSVTPVYSSAFHLTVSDVCGNNAFASENVYVECPITIPNVITPDMNGVNDFFEIKNIEDYPEAELVILNRWGNVVFESIGYKNDWNGDSLTEGVYFYKLYPKGRKYETGFYQGTVQILR